jgi:hypothetical protein
MNHFSILSPVLGERKDIPNIFLNKAYTPDSKNCQLWDGKVRTSYGRSNELLNASGVTIQTPDGMPVLKYLEHLSDSGNKSLLAFTSLHAYRWDAVLYSWLDASGVAMMTCSTGVSVTEWSVVSFNGKVVATNNIDVPQRWDGNLENKFAALNAEIASGITILRAKTVTVFENHVILGNYDLSNSDTYPNGIIWSDLDDETVWMAGTGSDAGAAYVDGEGVVSAFGHKNDLLYVFKTRSARVFWYTGTELIFSSRAYAIRVGTFAQDSVVNDDNGNLYFYGSDLSFREVDAGEISLPIKPVSRVISQQTSAIINIKSTFIDEYKEVWWSIPTGQSVTNNLVICFKNGVWYEREMCVSAFGKFSRMTSYTWDNQPSGTWDDWAGVWDDSLESAGWIYDICGDYYGYTYTSHSSLSDVYFDGSGMSSKRNPELVVNGGFDSTDNWIQGPAWSISDGKANFLYPEEGEPVGTLTQNIDVKDGHTYRVTITRSEYVGTSVPMVALGEQQPHLEGAYIIPDGTNTIDVTAIGDGHIILSLDYSEGSPGDTLSLDDISVKEIVDTESLSYYFVMTTDLADNAGLRTFKRLLYLYGYFTNINGFPVNIYIKQDSEKEWQLAGTMTTTGTADIHIGELAVDFRAKTFLVKIESEMPFEFLGMQFDYISSGDR